jgi:translocation and assembly module TamB
MDNRPPARNRRRFWRVLVVLLVLIVGVVASLPWAIGTPPGRRWVLNRADRIMAPGAFRFDTLAMSWFGPTQLTGFVLVDHQGDRVVAAPRATWDRSLWQVLFDRPRLGTLILVGAVLDVERRSDGVIDLYETIKPLLSADPRVDLTVQIKQGSLRFRSPELMRPLLAERADLTLQIPSAPASMTWQLRLANGGDTPVALAGSDASTDTLDIRGSFDRWKAAPGSTLLPNFGLALTARHWPLDFAVSGIESTGHLSGDIKVKRHQARWACTGNVWAHNLDATGPLLARDHLRLDRVGGTWDLAETSEGWTIHRLDLSSPLASLKAVGGLPAQPGSPTRIDGQLDLVALARQLPNALRLRDDIALERGSARLQVEVNSEHDWQNWQVEARVSDLVARNEDRVITFRDPATFSARLSRKQDMVSVERIGLKTPFLDASAQGDFDRGLALTATLDLDGLQRQLRDLIDFGSLELAGQGRLEGDYRRAGHGFSSHLTADLENLRFGGLGFDAVRCDQLQVDAVLNGPAAPSGFPRGWTGTQLTLGSGEAKAKLVASESEGVVDLQASASSPLTLGSRLGRAEGNFQGQLNNQALTISQLRLALRRADNGADPIALSARGRLDRVSGELVLEPSSEVDNSAISLSSDGLRLSGLGRDKTAIRADVGFVGQIALLSQAVSEWTGQPRDDYAGLWSLRLSASGADDGVHLGGRLDVSDLSWPVAGGRGRKTEGPIALALQGIYHAETDRIDLPEVVYTSRYATIQSSGQVTDLRGGRMLGLRGSMNPDWKTINAALAAQVEPNAYVKGTVRPFRLEGSLAGATVAEGLKGLDAEFGFDIVEADCFGMRMGATPVVLRAKAGRYTIDPIRTSLNQGRLRLNPELTIDDDTGLTLWLASGSSIENAEVNPDVSRRVLAYVAPILQDTTRVRGLVSAKIDRAEFPLMGGRVARKTNVEGEVAFRNVEFAPGPMADQLLDVVGLTNVLTMRLDQPVMLTIADGRVIQRGMAIALGGITRIELEGWVDFSRNLALTASLPITAPMLGNNPLLMDILSGTRISVPIRGTLSQPKLDRDAFASSLLDLTKTVVGRGAVRGATELLMRLGRVRDPQAAPPPPAPRPQPRQQSQQAPPRISREERRQQRIEKKAERRLERDHEPDL